MGSLHRLMSTVFFVTYLLLPAPNNLLFHGLIYAVFLHTYCCRHQIIYYM